MFSSSFLSRMHLTHEGSLRLMFSQGILPLLLIVSMVVFQVPSVFAATTPSLGAAASYAILAGTYTNTSAATTVTGDIGFTTGPAQAPLGVHPNYGSAAPTPTARTDAAGALVDLNNQAPCTFDFADGAIDLATDTTHGPAGIYTPGIYCTHGAGAASIGTAGITLSTPGTYIFRVNGALTSVDNSVVTLGAGVSACDVFWAPTGSTTLGATTAFRGTVIDNANFITVGADTAWVGRALSLGAGTVTTGATASITAPTCVTASSSSSSATGGDRTQRRPIISVTKIPNPLVLPGPGSVTYTYEVSNEGTYTMDTVTLADDKCANVTYISGDINDDALLQLSEVWVYSCTSFLSQQTNNAATARGFANGLPATDIAYATVNVGTQLPPPLIHVVKTPNILLLPFGGGTVTYTYEVTNPGIVALHNVQASDDMCGSVNYISGDVDDDNQLDMDETWTYTCKSNLALTTTNTVTVTGSAHNETATDVAFATVVVAPRPVITPLTLRSAAPILPPAPIPEVPLLPNTGVAGGESDIPWEVIAFSSLAAVSFLFAAFRAMHFHASKS